MTGSGEVRFEADDWKVVHLPTDDWETLRYQGPEGEVIFLSTFLRCMSRPVVDPATGTSVGIVSFYPPAGDRSSEEQRPILEQVWSKIRTHLAPDGAPVVVEFPDGLWRAADGTEWHQPRLPVARHEEGWTVQDWIDSSKEGPTVAYSDELCSVELTRSVELLAGYGSLVTLHAPRNWADVVVEGDAGLAAQRSHLILTRVASQYLDGQHLVRIVDEPS